MPLLSLSLSLGEKRKKIVCFVRPPLTGKGQKVAVMMFKSPVTRLAIIRLN